MLTNEQIAKRLRELGNAGQLWMQQMTDLQREVGAAAAPVSRTRRNLKGNRKMKYRAMIHQNFQP
jgi:hypothetical protein